MADKKLSSVPAVSDMNFVYAETASGETVKISKADLASVVAGLIRFGDVLMKKSNISKTDIDEGSTTITEVGMYYVVGTANDGSLVNDWGTAIIFKPLAGRYALLRFGYNCGKIGFALHNGNTWGKLTEL